jgi:hypothetical protein
MKIADFGKSFREDERHIAGKHQDVLVLLHRGASTHDGMAGAALLCLKNKPHARISHRILNLLCLMANDDKDIAGWRYLGCGCDYLRQQRPATNFVENFRTLGFESRAFTSRHNDDRKLLVYVVTDHGTIILPLVGEIWPG